MVLVVKVNHGDGLVVLAPDFHKANSQALTSTDSGPFHEPLSISIGNVSHVIHNEW